MRYIKKPVVVEAYNPLGEPYPCKPDIFLETYEPVSGMEPKL